MRRYLRAVLGLLCMLAIAAGHAETPPSARVQRLAWAGVRIDYGGATLVIDALGDTQAIGGVGDDPDIAIADPAPRRFALVTHAHVDHYDPALLKDFLGDNGTLVCDERMAAIFAGHGFKIAPTTLWRPIFLGTSGMVVIPVPALDAISNTDQVSWVVIAGQVTTSSSAQ